MLKLLLRTSLIKPVPDGKVCGGCDKHLPLDLFNKGNSRFGRHSQCKECRRLQRLPGREANKARCKAHYRAKRAEYVAKCKAWQQANPEKVRRAKRGWRERNLEYVRAWNREHAKSYQDPGVRRAMGRRRRARERGAGGSITEAEWQALLQTHNNQCAYCFKLLTAKGDATLDHKVPLIQGGSHTISNAVAACRSCNSRKKHRTVQEWHRSCLQQSLFLLPRCSGFTPTLHTKPGNAASLPAGECVGVQ
jgi:5-methylcytosine-specific restriction endonuclease McrA